MHDPLSPTDDTRLSVLSSSENDARTENETLSVGPLEALALVDEHEGIKNTNKGGDDRDNGPVAFVPYPHRPLGTGKQVACQWKTSGSMTKEESDRLVRSPSQGTINADKVQEMALSEGVCLPLEVPIANKLRIFSTEEATTCLARKRILFAGDSFVGEVFVGLGDILLANPSSLETNTREQRSAIVNSVSEVRFWVELFLFALLVLGFFLCPSCSILGSSLIPTYPSPPPSDAFLVPRVGTRNEQLFS